jgi:hypothetical protein
MYLEKYPIFFLSACFSGTNSYSICSDSLWNKTKCNFSFFVLRVASVTTKFGATTVWPSLKQIDWSRVPTNQDEAALASLHRIAPHLRSLRSFLTSTFSNTPHPQFLHVLRVVGKNLVQLELDINDCPEHIVASLGDLLDRKSLRILTLSLNSLGEYSPASLFSEGFPNLVTLKCKLTADLNMDTLTPLFGSLRHVHLVGWCAARAKVFPIAAVKSLAAANLQLETLYLESYSQVLSGMEEISNFEYFCGDFPLSDSECPIGVEMLKCLISDGQTMFDEYWNSNIDNEIDPAALRRIYNACFAHLSPSKRLDRLTNVLHDLDGTWASKKAREMIADAFFALTALDQLLLADAQAAEKDRIYVYVLMWSLWEKMQQKGGKPESRSHEPWKQLALDHFKPTENSSFKANIDSFIQSYCPARTCRDWLKSQLLPRTQ